MNYRVFSQTKAPRLDFAAVVRNATRYFAATVEVLEERGFDPERATDTTSARLRLENPRRGYAEEFTIVVRPALGSDYADAARAEAAGRAAGMAELATRCPYIWEVRPDSDSEAPTLNLCAILASAALGPVLPADGSTLFGVRGAMERLERIVGPSLQR